MEDAQRKLLDDHSALILPEEIDHNAYVLLLEAALHMAGKTLTLYCRGDGGGSRSSLAMVDLIQQHGNVTGMLAGEADSSHAIVWAACQHRYVYPHGRLGVHMVARDGIGTRVDSHVMKQMADDSERTNRTNALILANASRHDVNWWRELLERTGSGGMTLFDAEQLIEMGMARPIAEYQAMHSSNGLLKAEAL